ncbi:MAG: hypothetical protein BWY99_02171 [Synergistetes bacterium ADurb.BinA166]|nr:MAG: hypothetical protein BWY99_02171 [Synergistetes bacterium ADurb.BinA166]
MLVVKRTRGLDVMPAGSNLVSTKLAISFGRGIPYWRPIDSIWVKASTSPEMVLPGFPSLRNTSPGRPSGYSFATM